MSTTLVRRPSLWMLPSLLMAVPCFAHVEESEAGFLSGLLHPVFGIDHFLAMLSVGIVSAQLGGRNVFVVPALFVFAMIAGATLGLLKYPVPHLEIGIAASVVLLGAAVVLIDGPRYAYPILACVAFFGLLHGYAHGLEMPKAADPVYYGAGFVLSTAAIHLLGVAIGHFLTVHRRFNGMLRHAGSLMAGMGLMILIRVAAE